jgi:hypothetical protein
MLNRMLKKPVGGLSPGCDAPECVHTPTLWQKRRAFDLIQYRNNMWKNQQV